MKRAVAIVLSVMWLVPVGGVGRAAGAAPPATTPATTPPATTPPATTAPGPASATRATGETKAEAVPADLADVPQEEVTLGGDANKRYFLIGADAAAKTEPRGVLVVVPGGDGSADFNPFVRRIWKNALPKGFVAAHAVAPRWSDAENRVVWPTEKVPDANMTFTTEAFIEEIVADVKTKVNVDPARVFALGWSSGGPPVYTAAMKPGSSLKGAFVAMSVYHPESLPTAEKLEGTSFYVYHSPDDWIKIDFAKKAVEQLTAGGARVTLREYRGGHGWKGPIWQEIRAGVEWLMKESKDEGVAKP